MMSHWKISARDPRGNLHTQTVTLNVKLTFMVVWVEMPDFRVMTEMSKTMISYTTSLCF